MPPKYKKPLNLTSRTIVSPAIQPCAGCGEIHSYISIQLPDKSSLCFTCFEMKYPQYAAVNRLKKHGEQMELPL